MQKAFHVLTIAATVAIFFQMGCSKPSRIRRVMVSSPENWKAGESQSCVLAGEDPASKLPHLDCDLPASETRRSQMFVMDVRFATTPERQQYVEWTCKRTKSTLICGNEPPF